MKLFIITLWLVCGLAFSSAQTPRWQNVDDLISWLKSKEKLNVPEFTEAWNAIAHFRYHGRVDTQRESIAGELINTLALQRFAELREGKNLHGVSEFVEADYASSLNLRIMAILADGKDEEFSARILYQAVDSKSWTLPTKGFSLPYIEVRQKLFDKLVGNPETPKEYWNMDSTDGRKAVKRALEAKWPMLLEQPTTLREKRPNAQEVRQNSGISNDPVENRNDLLAKSWGFGKELLFWLIGIFSLIAVIGIFLLVKIRRRDKI